MKAKALLFGAFLVVALVAVVACSQDGATSTPTVVENPSLSVVTGEVKVPILICHHNPDLDDYMPEWHVIEVDNKGGKIGQSHCAHGDYNQAGQNGCLSCNLSYYGAYVGQDCGYCDD